MIAVADRVRRQLFRLFSRTRTLQHLDELRPCIQQVLNSQLRQLHLLLCKRIRPRLLEAPLSREYFVYCPHMQPWCQSDRERTSPITNQDQESESGKSRRRSR